MKEGGKNRNKKLSQEHCEAKFWVRVRAGKAGQIKDKLRPWSGESDGQGRFRGRKGRRQGWKEASLSLVIKE